MTKQYTQQQIIANRKELIQQLSPQVITYVQDDFYGFVRLLDIEISGSPQIFDFHMADFQREVFQKIAPSIEQLRKGGKVYPEWQRIWIERTKKASKDADLATIVLWLMAFPTRPFYAQIGAANAKQANIVKERIENLLEHNPWLNEYVELVQWEIRSKKLRQDGKTPMAKTHIMASNIGGSHGGTPDFLIINELTHVDKWEFIETLKDNADGVPHGVTIICTNAGFKGSKPERWREVAIESPDWLVQILNKPAPWHNQKFLNHAQKMEGTESRFRRLWWGDWVSGKGDALSENAINRIFRLTGPSYQPEDGWWYILGMDLGIKHDHSAVAVVGVNIQQRAIKVPLWKSWKPTGEQNRVYLPAVKEWVKEQSRAFRVSCIVYDPAEAQMMSQELESIVQTREMRFTSGNCNLMAETLIQVLNNEQLVCYDDLEGTLRRDFGKLCVEERKYGFKLEAVSDEFGHADVATAIVIALPHAVEFLHSFGRLNPDDDLYNPDDAKELTGQEMKTMPGELAEIYNMDYGPDPRLAGDDFGEDW